MDDQYTKPKIHPLSIVGALIFALVLIGLAYLVFSSQADKSQTAQTTPQFLVTLLPAPTETPTLVPTSILVTPTQSDVSILPPGVIAVGRYVKVIGTQGLGLRMRAEAGTSGEVNFLAMDDEAFKVIDGPIAKDGYTWWQCEALLDKTRSGWAAEDFLQVLELSTPQP
ncbi:MAG TPA: hypothetical protein DD636_01460 [Anaerolineaceae bacterium]|jgi:hypothetical protein|nr:hypothetical protein [Anaerolineaceae bacterium]